MISYFCITHKRVIEGFIEIPYFILKSFSTKRKTFQRYILLNFQKLCNLLFIVINGAIENKKIYV